MKKKIKTILLMFLFIINLSALASLAYHRWGKASSVSPQTEGFEVLESLREPIALDQNQLQQLRSLREKLEQEIAVIREEMQSKRETLAREINKSNPDLEMIDKIIDEVSYHQSQIQKRTIRSMMQDRQILSPDQQTRYFSLFEDHVRGMRRGRGRGLRVRGRRGHSQKRN